MERESNAPGALAGEGTIALSEPNLGEAETEAVLAALRSGYVSSVGPAVDAFESHLAERVGSAFAVACSSGTAALHVALRVAGVGPGAEVWCSDFTFAGSGNPISYLGARPVYIDSELETWNIDPAIVVDELESRARRGAPMPAAIEVVHVLGQPAQLAPILEAGQRHGVPIIEDAAESLGAGWTGGTLAGRQTGAAGLLGCFSFNGNKIATAGGGGMIVTDDPELARRARHLTTQAKAPGVGYLHDEVGYNYRLTNLAAALGDAQLSRLPEFLAAKHRIARHYDEAFDRLPLTLPPRLPGYAASYWMYSVLTQDAQERDRLLAHLADRGVGARPLWRPLHLQPSFAGSEHLGGDVGVSLFERGVSLPNSTHLSDDAQERVIDAVRSFFG